MAKVDTAPLVETSVPIPSPADGASNKNAALSAVVADIATMGTGTLVAGFINAALVFIVPKLLSVEDYGYWRIFGLYGGYVGFLHFGFADGALLRWAGKPWKEFQYEIGPALKYLVAQHVVLLVPVCGILGLVLSGPLRFVALAIGAYALIYNSVALLQFGLQDAKIFRPVAISTVAAPALFLGFVLLLHTRWQIGYREVIGFYAAGWVIAAGFLLAWAKPWQAAYAVTPVFRLAKQCVLSGWPIVLANTGIMLVIYADRLAVSWAVDIQKFAQYSMAASAMAVPILAIQACSKVSFSHLAAVSPERRKRVYGTSSRMLLIAWAILLPYYFALDVFVHHVLPRYVESLQYARILLLGVPFIATVQILQTSYAYLHGVQRRFLAQTVVVLVVSLSVTSYAAFHATSLTTVASVQVVMLGAWWLGNEWVLREFTRSAAGEWAQFLCMFGLASLVYWETSAEYRTTFFLVYYGALAIFLALLCRGELRFFRKLQRHG